MKTDEDKKTLILRVVCVCCLCVFILSSVMVITKLTRDRKEKNAFDDLASQVAAAGESEGFEAEEEFHKYDALYEQNNDLFGWINIAGTVIDYPVMHTPDDPEHYLHTAFDGSYSYSGVPFLAGECYTGGGNYIVYGHHMKNGTMFAGIEDYADEDFWREHPVIKFDTVYEPGEYEVMAAFYSRVFGTDEDGVFRYYGYTDLTDEDTYNEYLENIDAVKLYDTGVTAVYGDQLLTLSTCDYHTDEGRFVVVAVKTGE